LMDSTLYSNASGLLSKEVIAFNAWIVQCFRDAGRGENELSRWLWKMEPGLG
jgi:hypothetical protein